MRCVFIVLASLLFLLPATVKATQWQNVCPDTDVIYCSDLGKTARNATGSRVMKSIVLGTITGVSWRPKGSVIGISPAIPTVGIPEEIRLSHRDAYYYIIDDGGKPFLRMCREIKVR